MFNGILNVYKEKGYTSFDAVARVRGICRQKKAGHTGTLDPQAEGVLPVCLGRATKVCGMLIESSKEYEAVMLLGKETDTLDLTGSVLRERPTDGLTEKAVRDAILSFQGGITQIPPMYSAVKVNGKRLYDYARKGVEIERRPRKVTIEELEILSMDLPEVTMRIRCSKGTYIRTLCDDIGRKLGCGGCMKALIRTEAAGLRIEDALRLDEIEQARDAGKLGEVVRSVDCMFSSCRSLQTVPEYDRLLANGGKLKAECFASAVEAYRDPQEWLRIYDSGGTFIGIFRYDGEQELYRPLKMFGGN